MSDPKKEFEPGQLVNYIGPMKDLTGVWEVVGYKVKSGTRHLWDVRRPEDHEKVSAIYNTNMKLVENKEETPAAVCTCSIMDLMAKGCTCGQMERERAK